MRVDRVFELLAADRDKFINSWKGKEHELLELTPDKLSRLKDYATLTEYVLNNANDYIWFDLGTLNKKEVDDITDDFVKTEGVVDKSIRLPYDRTVFTLRVCGMRTGFVDIAEDHLETTHESDDIVFVMLCEQAPADDRIMLSVAAYMDKNNRANLPARPTILHKVQRDDGMYMWSSGLVSVGGIQESNPAYDKIDTMYSNQVVPVFDYALNLLACDNIVVKTEQAPEKLNKKREKQGNPFRILDRRTVHVDVEGCEVFRYNGSSGTHASPVVHLRRGHVRRLAEGRTTWVKPCVVGKKGKLVDTAYKVE